MRKKIRFDYLFFWPGFSSGDILKRFPYLSLKYDLIHDPNNPEVLFFSVFTGITRSGKIVSDTMPTPPDLGIPTIFLTGENVVPDLNRCDYAISFSRDIDVDRHIRIPNWVQRFYQIGLSPECLIKHNSCCKEMPAKFCAFVYRNRVPIREDMFIALSRLRHVDAPSFSMNNMDKIGAGPIDKLNFLLDYRFSIAFENNVSSGYTTEKLPEALYAGTIPIYWGDPDVDSDFNSLSFLNLANFASIECLAEEVIRIELDSNVYKRIRSEAAYNNNKLPACANTDRAIAFFEKIFG